MRALRIACLSQLVFVVTAILFSTTLTAQSSTSVLTISSAKEYVCEYDGGLTLSTQGGNGQWGGYQWGTVSANGEHLAIEISGASRYFNPQVTTTYWVRTHANGNFGPYVYKTITYYKQSTQPTSISVFYNECLNTFTLTAVGAVLRNGAKYEWYNGWGPGNAIANSNSVSIMVPNTNTHGLGYFVRVVENTPCPNNQWGVNVSMPYKSATTTPQLIGFTKPVVSELCKNQMSQGVDYIGSGEITGWESSTTANFTSDVTSYATTSSHLTTAAIGPLATTTYFRVVIQTVGCGVYYATASKITVGEAAVFQDGVWSKTPSLATALEIRSDLTLVGNLEGCSCEINNQAVVQVLPMSNLTVKSSIIVRENAQLLIADQGSLVQIEDYAVNSGSITKEVTSTPMKNFDYTYWSSPVAEMTLKRLSPLTLNDKYHSYNPIAGAWVNHVGGQVEMQAGKGYIVRAPQGWSVTNATQGRFTAQFTGVPNNGIVNLQVNKGTSTLNLLGNPYASGIDIEAFITHPTNRNVVDGTVYLWTHTTALAQVAGLSGLNYIADDYAKFNLTGGVATGHPAHAFNSRPTGKIASGQGFFIHMNDQLPANSATITFDNSMRISNSIAQFYRQSESVTTAEKSRIWLHIQNQHGAFNQALVGYLDGATNELDRLYDGKTNEGAPAVSLYSLVEGQSMSIQGRALPFDATDIVPLGFKVTTAGTYTIGLGHFDGLFGEQAVYLYDNELDLYHDLKQSDYSFTTAAGRFEDRFEVRYTESTLGTDDPTTTSGIVAFAHNQQIHLQAGQLIQRLRVVDLAGRELLQINDLSVFNFVTDKLPVNQQLVLLQIDLANGLTQTKKILLK